MPDKYPYVQSPNHLVQTIIAFRSSLPAKVDATIFKKLGIAPNNESYVLTTLRFLGLIDKDGKRTKAAEELFYKQDDKSFNSVLESIIKQAYSELFELRGDGAWTLNLEDLMTHFRENDKTSEKVGKLQSTTFQTLAALCGHGELQSKTISTKETTKKPREKRALKITKPVIVGERSSEMSTNTKSFGLTVRIEINLPADGKKETYDMIFQSIRENLINE